jgi:hypothetical protein
MGDLRAQPDDKEFAVARLGRESDLQTELRRNLRRRMQNNNGLENYELEIKERDGRCLMNPLGADIRPGRSRKRYSFNP